MQKKYRGDTDLMENREHLEEKKIAIIISDLQGSEAVRQVLHTMRTTVR